MSIQSLQQRLAKKLEERTQQQDLNIVLPKPHRLIRRLQEIEHHFDQKDYHAPDADKILQAIEKLEREGTTKLSKRDWKNITWGLSRDFEHRPKKLIFLNSGFEALDSLRTIRRDLIPNLYLPLLISYFAVEKEELNQNSNNWLILREILDHGLADLHLKYKRPKDWVLILRDYKELLQAQPTKRLSLELINDEDDNSIFNKLNHLNIPIHSWFWERLMKDAIKSITMLSDQIFKEKIDRLLNLAETNPIYSIQILANVLDRYANSQYRDQIHERIKQMALKQWSNPQDESAAGWSNVQPDTKKMVIQWFVQADLEAFFKLFSDYADVNRFNYWMRFINQISYSRLILGNYALSSMQLEHKEFRKNNRGRYDHLKGGTSVNNAFIIKIHGYYLVEFSEMGPCYINNKKIIIENLGSKVKTIHLNYLRNGDRYTHQGNWQKRFDEMLAERGIFPDYQFPKSSYSTEYKRI